MHSKVSKTIDFKKLKPKQAEKLFDTLISPILTYGCEVWDVYLKQNFASWDKELTEKVHLRFCKYYLGVNSKASNSACRAELGRLPMKIFNDKLILHYWNHLLDLPVSTIAKQAFLVSKSLYEKRKTCYHSNLHNTLKFYNINVKNDLTTQFSNPQLAKYHCSMKSEYLKFWENSVSHSRKLEFYQKFKVNYETESYLDIIRTFDQRRVFTKFRISNHNLAIESGRYTNTLTNDRICVFCSLNAIESEEHMLLNCTLYNSLRNHFFDKMNSFDIKVNLNNYHELLLTNNDKVFDYLAIFISKCFKLCDNILEVLRNK